MQPLAKEAQSLYEKWEKSDKNAANKGLLFERLYNGYGSNFEVDKTSDTDALRALVGACGNKEQIERAARRRHEMVKSLGGEYGIFSTDWHFVTGMGNNHPAENGFTWHPTLGTPYLLGSSVKGLLRAWMEAWVYEGADNKAKREEIVHAWFGRDAKKEGNNDSGKAGDLIFFDAIPVEQPDVLLDIMTPHMGKWYEKGDGPINAENQPGDWHSPVPINFLVTEKAQFLFAIAPRTEAAKAYVKEAMEYLKQALAWLGAGSKTAAGYGHMSYEEQLSNVFFKSNEEKHAAKLAESGIVVASTTWPKAHISEVSPGSGDITVTYDGKTAKGKFYSELSKSTKEKAKKKKAYIEVDIEQQGNQVLIIAVRELPSV